MTHPSRPRLSTSMALVTGAWLVVVLAEAVPAVAQSGGSRVAVSVGGGVGHSFLGDFDYYAPGVEGSVALRLSPRMSVDVGISTWRRTEREVRIDVPILGATGPVGRIGRLEERTRHAFTMAEVNVMALAHAGPVRLLAGGGAGILTLHREFRQETSGCTGAASCGAFENTFASVSPVVQGGGRVEVPLGGRLAAYASGRLFVNLRDAGGSGTRFTGGIAVGF